MSFSVTIPTMYTYPPKNDYQCECGKAANSRIFSPSGKNICRECRDKYSRGFQAEYLAMLEKGYQRRLLEKKGKDAEKAKAKRKRKKEGIAIYTGEYAFDTPEFRKKQATVMSRKKRLKEAATPSEIRIRGLLDELNLYYIEQKAFIAYDYYAIVDFYLHGIKLCIEIDGGYHDNPEQIKKDKRRDQYLTETRGFLVCRIKNEVADKMTSKELLDIVIDFKNKYDRKSTIIYRKEPLFKPM